MHDVLFFVRQFLFLQHYVPVVAYFAPRKKSFRWHIIKRKPYMAPEYFYLRSPVCATKREGLYSGCWESIVCIISGSKIADYFCEVPLGGMMGEEGARCFFMLVPSRNASGTSLAGRRIVVIDSFRGNLLQKSHDPEYFHLPFLRTR